MPRPAILVFGQIAGFRDALSVAVRHGWALVNSHNAAVFNAHDLGRFDAVVWNNVVTRETLLAAQANPEQHRDLVVRMPGYSAYFVQLSRTVQDEIIGRMEHERI